MPCVNVENIWELRFRSRMVREKYLNQTIVIGWWWDGLYLGQHRCMDTPLTKKLCEAIPEHIQ